MKDTPEVRQCVEEIATYYSNKMNLTKYQKPDIFFNGITLPGKFESVFKQKDHPLAQFFSDNKTLTLMRIDLSLHRSVRELQKSIVHELVHIKYPYMSHNTRFYDKIQEVLCECESNNNETTTKSKMPIVQNKRRRSTST